MLLEYVSFVISGMNNVHVYKAVWIKVTIKLEGIFTKKKI